MLRRIIFGITLLFVSVTLHAENPDDIIKANIKATGVEKAKDIKSWKLEGEMFVQQIGQYVPITWYYKAPEMYRQEVEVMGNEVISAYDGETAWMVNPMAGSTEPQKIPAEQAEMMLGSMKQNMELFLNPFSDYLEEPDSVNLEYVELANVDGEELHKIKFQDANDSTNVSFAFFDPVSNYLVKVMVENNNPAGGEDSEIYFEGRKKINGIVVPTKIIIMSGVKKTAEFSFKEIEANADIEDSIFKMPAKED